MVTKVHDKAIKYIKEDMDIVNVLKTISKLKAAVSALMLQNHDIECLVDKAQKKYYENCTIDLH